MEALLNWLEKKTRTDIRYVINGSFWMLISQAVIFLFSLLLLWAFANLTSQELYGQYRFFVTVIGLVSIASLPGMQTAVIRAVARGNSGVIPEAVRERIKWGLFGSLAALCGALYYYIQNDLTLTKLFLLIALFAPFYESFLMINAHEVGRKDYRSFTALSIARYATITLPTLAAVLISTDIIVIFGTFLLASTVANYGSYKLSVFLHPLSKSTDTETVAYGRKLSFMSAIATGAGQLDKIALWYLAGPVQVAVYTIAIALPRELSGALSQVVIIALPKMAAQEKMAMHQALLRKIFIFFLASVPLYIFYLISAPFIFSWFLPQYLDSVLFSQIAALLILLAPLTLLTQYFNATMHTKALYAQQFVIPVISIILLFVLIPFYGILGAVLALVAKQICSFFLLLFFFLTDRHDTPLSISTESS